MADTIKIGSLDISSFKVGSSDCKVYLGDTLLYPQSQPQTLQWVTFNNGDTIPSGLNVYGVSGISQDLLSTYGNGGSYIQFQMSKRYIEYYIYNSDSSYCADGSELATDPMEIIFSNRGCSNFINQGATVSGTIKLYIYDSPTPPTPTTYTYSVTIQGLENGDTTRISWNFGDHVYSNVGNGTYTYTTTADTISVNLDMDGLSDYTVDFDHFMLHSGGSQTVTFTYQGGGGGLVQIPYGTDMSQYYNRYIKRIVIGDATYSGVYCLINNWGNVSTGYITVAPWGVYSGGDFSGISSLPIDAIPTNPVQLLSWNYNNGTTNPFNDLQIEWA